MTVTGNPRSAAACQSPSASLLSSQAVSFSVNSGEVESVVVLVQGAGGEAAAGEEIEGDIRQIVKEAVGVDSEIVMIPRQPGLPLTSSGKLSRSRAKATFVAGGYARHRPVLTIV